MLWLIVILISYFLLAAVNLVDKHILQERIPDPKVYAFYVGISGIFILALLPFGFLEMPSSTGLFLALLAGAFNTLAVLALYVALKKFETSRIIPAVGAFLPIFTFGFTAAWSGEGLAVSDVLVFALLLIGAFLITLDKKKSFSLKCLPISFLTAGLFAAYFILIKFVYLDQPFVSGLIWSKIGAALLSLVFLCFKDVRMDILHGPKIAQKRNWSVVLPNQIAGGSAVILQNWAVALAPLALLGIVNALEGIKYAFLLIIAVLISRKFPKILKEEVSREVVLQKIIAILFVGAGLIILAF